MFFIWFVFHFFMKMMAEFLINVMSLSSFLPAPVSVAYIDLEVSCPELVRLC